MISAVLSLSSRQLNTLVFSFTILEKMPAVTKDERAARSVLDKLVLKIRKRYLDINANTSIFKKTKKYSFGFEYHEAYHLEQFVVTIENVPMNEYDHNVLHFIKSTLNQQLA